MNAFPQSILGHLYGLSPAGSAFGFSSIFRFFGFSVIHMSMSPDVVMGFDVVTIVQRVFRVSISRHVCRVSQCVCVPPPGHDNVGKEGRERAKNG